MKARDVILQLHAVLPKLTDEFTVDVVLNSVTSSGLVATATTATNHGLSVGALVNIIDINTPISITSITRSADVLTVVTAERHDLTLEAFEQNVTLVDANEAEFNGTFELLDVPNRTTFTLATTDSGATTGTGAMKALDIGTNAYSGLYNVASVPSSTTFTYAIPFAISLPSYGTGRASVGFRISGAANFDRAFDSYTKQESSELWAFVVLGNVVASKDRNINSDAVAINAGNTEWKQQLIQNFSIFVFATVSDELAARSIRDNMEDIAANLFKSIVGVKLNSYLTTDAYYKVVFDSHSTIQYDGTRYIHGFNFQSVADLTSGDIYFSDEDVAFRDIDLTIATTQMTDDTERLSQNISLDDEVL